MRTSTALLFTVALCCVALAVQAKKTDAKAHHNVAKFVKEHSLPKAAAVNSAAPSSDSAESMETEDGTKIVIVNKVCGETTNVNQLSKAANATEFTQLSDSAESAENENKIIIVNKMGCPESEESAE